MPDDSATVPCPRRQRQRPPVACRGGGAIYLQGPSHASLTECSLSGNRAAATGDAFLLSATDTGRNTLTLNSTTFSGHHRVDIFAQGAAANNAVVVAASTGAGTATGTPVSDLQVDGGANVQQVAADAAAAGPPVSVAGGRPLLSGDEEWLLGALQVCVCMACIPGCTRHLHLPEDVQKHCNNDTSVSAFHVHHRMNRVASRRMYSTACWGGGGMRILEPADDCAVRCRYCILRKRRLPLRASPPPPLGTAGCCR